MKWFIFNDGRVMGHCFLCGKELVFKDKKIMDEVEGVILCSWPHKELTN